MRNYSPDEIDYSARVNEGIKLLDEKWADWWRLTRTDILDISSGTFCMTAQAARILGIGSSWISGMNYFGLDDESYILHGFNVEDTPYVANDEGDFNTQEGWEAYENDQALDILTSLWVSAIVERRAKARLNIAS